MNRINAMAIPGLKTPDEIAAEIWDFHPGWLKMKTRKREVVEARQSLMKFRNENMGKSLASAAQPYGLDHVTVLHAIKTVEKLRQTNKAFRIKHDLFLTMVTKITGTGNATDIL